MPGEDPHELLTLHRKTVRALRERVKELNCLYSITRFSQREDLSTTALIKGIAELVRESWQYPEVACSRVLVEGEEYRTAGYEPSPWVQSSIVSMRGEEIGLVEVRYLEPCPPSDEGPFLNEERHLIDAVADLLSQIMEARKIKAQVQRLSRELIKAQESERQRIARELHDKAAQDLSLLKIELEALNSSHGPLPPEARTHVSRLLSQTSGIINEIRDISYALLPPDLEQLGLASAAFRLCEEFTSRHGVVIEFSADGMHSLCLGFETQINLYRIIQEALTNIRKHSGAKRARVLLVASHPFIILRIEDDGVGFDPGTEFSGQSGGRHMGLLSMRERARLIGGRFVIRSAHGKGTRIVLEVPAGGVESS
ncbi:MAG: sensor histidine kinase [Desulfovibrio sp.]|nr:sensor histidine kinase [Desulfovibrio sp.]MBI4959698.1 sensor histidine kinase [Desulfovibrio sp.]